MVRTINVLQSLIVSLDSGSLFTDLSVSHLSSFSCLHSEIHLCVSLVRICNWENTCVCVRKCIELQVFHCAWIWSSHLLILKHLNNSLLSSEGGKSLKCFNQESKVIRFSLSRHLWLYLTEGPEGPRLKVRRPRPRQAVLPGEMTIACTRVPVVMGQGRRTEFRSQV